MSARVGVHQVQVTRRVQRAGAVGLRDNRYQQPGSTCQPIQLEQHTRRVRIALPRLGSLERGDLARLPGYTVKQPERHGRDGIKRRIMRLTLD